MGKTIYTVALSFNHRQQVRVCEYNGFFLSRDGKGSHEIWRNSTGIEISMPVNCKGTTFADIARKHKFVFVDARGKKVY